MRITIFGASGKIGQLVTKQLISEGHHVTAFVHSKNPFGNDQKVNIVKGDIHNQLEVFKAVSGSDIIISTLGSWGTKEKDIVSSGMASIIDAAKRSKVSRIISLTGVDAHSKNDNLTLFSRITHLLITYSPAKKILQDGEDHIRMLESSNLSYTVLRSPIMNYRGKSSYKLINKAPYPWQTINRNAVAKSIVDQVSSSKYINKCPYIIHS